MSKLLRKRDRTARLLRMQIVLWQYPHGIEIDEIARKCNVSKRTVYRDLEALETELGIPIWEDGSKRGVTEGYFLPPITFTLPEAMNIFLAARLTQNFSHLYNPSMASTFMKLNTIVPQPLKQQVHNTIEYLEKQPRDERKISNFDKLTRAWLSQHQVKIRYQQVSEEPVESIIEPYYIEPVAWGRSTYIIAYSHQKQAISNYKIDQIVGSVEILRETYKIPADFDINDYLGSAWGIYTDEELVQVKLRFNQKVSKAATGTTWHHSQKTEPQADGATVMTLNIRNTVDFRGWVMGWGENVEVLEPQVLRDQIIEINNAVRNIYLRGQ
jgi:proteasome accessory factor B